MASRARQAQPAAGDDHPLRKLRRRRGLTQVELAGLAGLSCSYISMIERGHRALNRRDHINAVAAALRVSPSELAPSTISGLYEWAPASSGSAPAFTAGADEITVTRHAHLAREFIAHVARGDTYAAGRWLRRTARDPSVNPWLLLDQLTAPGIILSGPHTRPLGGSGARLISADSAGQGRAAGRCDMRLSHGEMTAPAGLSSLPGQGSRELSPSRTRNP